MFKSKYKQVSQIAHAETLVGIFLHTAPVCSLGKIRSSIHGVLFSNSM